MFRSIWKAISYVFSGEAQTVQLEAYIAARNPRNEKERHEVVREYFRNRGF